MQYITHSSTDDIFTSFAMISYKSQQNVYKVKKGEKLEHLSLKEGYSVTMGVVMKEQFEMSSKTGGRQSAPASLVFHQTNRG